MFPVWYLAVPHTHTHTHTHFFSIKIIPKCYFFKDKSQLEGSRWITVDSGFYSTRMWPSHYCKPPPLKDQLLTSWLVVIFKFEPHSWPCMSTNWQHSHGAFQHCSLKHIFFFQHLPLSIRRNLGHGSLRLFKRQNHYLNWGWSRNGYTKMYKLQVIVGTVNYYYSSNKWTVWKCPCNPCL